MGTKNETIKHIVRFFDYFPFHNTYKAILTDSIKFEIHWIHRIRHMFEFPQLDVSPKQPGHIFRKKKY